MKIIPIALQTHINQDATTLAACWLIVAKDNTIRAYTSLDTDIVIDGITYKSTASFTPTDVQSNSRLAVDNLEVSGYMQAGDFTLDDIKNGKWDQAKVSYFLVNYKDVSAGKIDLKYGTIGDINITDDSFTAEIRGLSQALNQSIGEVTSKTCRAQLGDARCKKDLTAFTYYAVITDISEDGSVITTDAGLDLTARIYVGGVLEMTSGAGVGQKEEVRDYTANVLSLQFPLNIKPAIGDSFKVHIGCDKTITTCATVFNNAVNFRGEPHLPGNTAMIFAS